MYEVFAGALHGDPLYQQHLLWLLSKPAIWLVMTKWALVAIGIIWILRVLVASQEWKAVGVFTVMLGGASLLGIVLFQQAKLGFENGQGGTFAWRAFGLVTEIFAIGVIVMLWKRFRNRGRQEPSRPHEGPTMRSAGSKPPEIKEYEFHIWLGHYKSSDDLTDFFREQYEDFDQPLSEFAESQGQRGYDHDGIEYGCKPDQKLDSWLNLSGSSKGALSDAYQVSQQRGIIDPTIYVQANRDEFSDPKSVAVDRLKLTYMGLFRETYVDRKLKS